MLTTRQAVGRVGSAVRFWGPNDPRTHHARQDLAESVIARCIDTESAKVDALRADQVERLLALLSSRVATSEAGDQ